MQSPFPGMDPYIEASGLWEDFHTKLIVGIDLALDKLLSKRYFVTVGERFYVVLSVADQEQLHRAQADISIDSSRRDWSPAAASSSSSMAVAESTTEPIDMTALVEESFREHFLEIREVGSQRLVTVIEALSPSNKRFDTEGWRQYLRKTQACISSESLGFVEIDLLRGGQRMPMNEPWPTSPYYLLVNRPWQGHRCQVWRADFIRPLPPLQIPLAKPDPDIELMLQPIIASIYATSRYSLRIDYDKSLSPPLDETTLEWLNRRRQEIGESGTIS